jgi:hypothetical protein
METSLRRQAHRRSKIRRMACKCQRLPSPSMPLSFRTNQADTSMGVDGWLLEELAKPRVALGGNWRRGP